MIKTQKIKNVGCLDKKNCILVPYGCEKTGKKILSKKKMKTEIKFIGFFSQLEKKVIPKKRGNVSDDTDILKKILEWPIKPLSYLKIRKMTTRVFYICENSYIKYSVKKNVAPVMITIYMVVELRVLMMLLFNIPSASIKISNTEFYKNEMVFYHLFFQCSVFYKDLLFECLKNWTNVMYNLPQKANILDVVNYTRPVLQILWVSGLDLSNCDTSVYILNEVRQVLLELNNYTLQPSNTEEYNAVISKFMTASVATQTDNKHNLINPMMGQLASMCSIKGIMSVQNETHHNKEYPLNMTSSAVVCNTFIQKKEFAEENQVMMD